MATERDTYQLDTGDAVRSLEELGRAYDELAKDTAKATEQTESLAQMFKDDLAKSFMTAQAQYELLKQAFQSVVGFVKEGIEAWEKTEVGLARQAVLLKNAGDASLMYSDRLAKQADRIQTLTGLDDTYVTNLQNVILGMGVGVNEIERYTEAAVKLSLLMGTDATQAARLLARANAEGKEELKKFGIVAKDGVDLLTQVEERTRGISDAMPEYTKLVHGQAAAWDSFRKAVGGVAAEIYVFLNRDMIAMNRALADMEKTMTSARWMELRGIYAQHGVDIDYARKQMGNKPEGPEFDKEALGKSAAASRDAANKAAQQKAKEEYAFFLELAKGYYEEQKSLREKSEKEAAAGRDKFYKLMQNEAEDDKEIELGIMEQFMEGEKQIEQARRETKELIARTNERILQEEIQFWQSMKDQAKSYAEQVAGTMVGFFGDMLMENTEFNRQTFELQVERETAGMSEMEANKKRAEMEGKVREEKIASFEKELAASLMSIAKDSAVKALFEGAEAIASAAMYDYTGAAQHGIAAALYAGVAVAAGGAAYALNSGRGMTGDESQRLEAAKAKKDKDEREAKQKSQRGGDGIATQVTVNYLGIAGLTELQQAEELERIRKNYNKLNTGSK